jgi:hypothetical protein
MMWTIRNRLVRFRPASALTASLLTAAISLACSSRSDYPPDAEFLVATADSTFWVRSSAQGIKVRAVPMTLAHFNGRFHEVFIADLDRSFDDAVLTGERVYVRDLQTNDSSLVYDDTAITAIAGHYRRTHPDAVPLGPDDDSPANPDISATGETDILEIRGPYALLEHRLSFESQTGTQHDTVRTAVDLRSGAAATTQAMIRESARTDSNLVEKLPRSWERKGYTLYARAIGDGSVLLSMRDGARHSWTLFAVGARPRVYWLDDPPIPAASRRALLKAFNSAASYDESVKFANYVPQTVNAPSRRLGHA